MLNYETLLSSYDDKLTLMQWLKKVEEALKDASAVSFNVNKRGDATLTFSVVFEDGSELETGPIVLEQGESVQAAIIRNGHLILTLTNGDELDAGDTGAVTGFFINGSQHLIVQYQNGTTQDLGAIFSGNITISGNLSVSGDINGIANPSVKPLYYHPIYIFYPDLNFMLSCVIINNSPTAFTKDTFLELISTDNFRLAPANGFIQYGGNVILLTSIACYSSVLYGYGIYLSSGDHANAIDLTSRLTEAITNGSFQDGVNKIN